ncbi:MAG: TonB-dependent receptor, partial [Hyphomonadaceae bacterium]|nr:TonB-dependent receptor [Hyphomonadaceae bacterium]
DYDRFDNSLFILRYRPGGIPADTTDIGTLDPAAYLLLDVSNPVYGQYQIPTPGPNTNREEVLEGLGFYIQDQIDITDKLQIRIGGRFDDFEQDLTNLRATPATTITTSDTRFSPQVGAVYRVNDGVSVYVSYGEGFRQQTGSDFAGNPFDPNITDSAEIGFKTDLGEIYDRVDGFVSVTFFQVDQSNILVNDDRPEAVAAGFFSFPAGEARSRGIEFDAGVEFENALAVWFSYAYTDAEFTNSNPDMDFGATIEEGDRLINSPRHQLNIQVRKGFDLAGMPAQIGGGVLHVGERVGWTGFDFFLPDYTTVRAFGEIDPVENFSLRLDVDNVFDETFYTNSYADVWVEPGAPRRFRLTAAYDF